jgi:uncharacterized membrane protein YfcA
LKWWPAAILGSLVGKRLLGGMESKTFRRLAVAVMVVSGAVLTYGRVVEWLGA